jgi:hypothetical protein
MQNTLSQPKTKTVLPDVKLTANEWFEHWNNELNKSLYGTDLKPKTVNQ